ncbi:MAG TPA: hypothetical protein VF614_13810 [Chthoniobacteraceae bacterium]|jgi:hypothetical protein
MKTKEYTYNLQHACFQCCKVFKLAYQTKRHLRAAWLSRRLSGRQPSSEFQEPPHVCPECGGPVEMMGRAFRAPRTNNSDGWRRVALLVQAGYRFFSYSSGSYPSNLRGIREFIATHRTQSKGERLARHIKTRNA